MKKFLLSLAVLVSAIFVASAADGDLLYTVQFGANYNSAKVSAYDASFAVTDNGVSFTIFAMNNNNNQWSYVGAGRKNNASTPYIASQSALEGNMSTVVLNANWKSKNVVNSAKLLVAGNASFTDAVEYDITSDINGKNSNTSVFDLEIAVTDASNKYFKLVFDLPSYTANGVLLIHSLKFYGTAGAPSAVATPAMEMTAGTDFYTVTMTTETEGAEIRYTTDETEPTASSTLYTAPIEIYGPTTFKAVAIKDGELSSVRTFKADAPYFLEGFGALFDLRKPFAGDVNVIVNGKMTAVAQSGINLLTKDESGNYMLLYGNLNKEFTNGDTFNRLEGLFTVYNGLPEIKNPLIVGEVSAGTPVSPTPATLSDVKENMLLQYLSLQGVTISNIDGKNAKLTDREGNEVALYNNFGLTLEEGVCNMTGFVNIYETSSKTTIQFSPITIDMVTVTVEAPEFSIPSGSTVSLYSALEITCPEEGATVWYRMSANEEFEEGYTVYFYAMGTYTIEAYAEKDGVRSETVTATYTVGKASRDLQFIDEEGNPVTEVVYVFENADEAELPWLDGISDEAEFTSSNPEVAYINDMFGITVVGLGTTVITAKCPENTDYQAGEASFTLKVISLEEAESNIATVVVFGDQPEDFGYSADKKDCDWVGTGDFIFATSVTIASGNNYPKYYAPELRVYASASTKLTVNAPAGYEIKSLTMDVDGAQLKTTLPTIDGNNATKVEATSRAAADTQFSYEFTTPVTSFVLGCSATSNQLRISQVAFNIAKIVTGLEAVSAAADAEAVYYNLQGVRVDNPAAGLYIRVRGAEVSKVMIR